MGKQLAVGVALLSLLIPCLLVVSGYEEQRHTESQPTHHPAERAHVQLTRIIHVQIFNF